MMHEKVSSINSLEYSDFVIKDKEECDLYALRDFEMYKKLQRENRGIIIKDKGGESLKTRDFAEYCISKRIKMFRIENGDRYLYNYVKHKYENVSENTLSAILLIIIEEYSTNLFGSKAQDEAIRYLDLLCDSFLSLPEEKNHIILQNGTYDVEKDSFEPQFTEDIKNTYVMNYEYDRTADCPRFKNFLDDIFNGDVGVINVVQEFFGYTFCYGDSPIDKFFYFWSVGRSGKSVLANILRNLHGVERVSALALDRLEERFQLATLVGKVVNITPEGSKARLQNTSILKSLTGRDAVLIEEKYKLPYSTVLHTKLLIVANHFLYVNDDSFGFWQRVMPIPFPNVYVPLPTNGKKRKGVKYQNLHLEDELLQELSGIFNWAIEGLERLKKNGFSFSYSETIEEFKEKLMLMNRPIENYVNECIVEADITSKIKSSEVHAIFKDWAIENEVNIGEYFDSRKFHREFKSCLQAKGVFYEVRKNSVDYYYGIKFNEEKIEID